MSSIHSILKEYWGYDHFRPLQEDIINTVLSGKDCLALLPTGGGKSICFQVPVMYNRGLCLVISPLIALMKDQVENLRRKNITAFSIYSGMTRKEVINTLEVAGQSNCRFLYVSPERLETNVFKEYLPSLGVKLIAVDEAHCISQWGYDFRPAYLKIAALREELPEVPVLALTASATKEVQDDICERLLFKEKRIFRQSFSRPNLSYSVFEVDSPVNKILDVLSKVEGTAIVYCRSRKRTREISDILKMNGISSDFYHAGLSQEQRSKKQEAWLKNELRVMVCTNAFGMGIDKPDVRLVLHADVPDCLENYYQEAGRAGRDGKRSYAVLCCRKNETDDLLNSLETRFPPLSTIRKIYGALMNYLQIPAGSGEGDYYDFDIAHFNKTFSTDPLTVVSVLKTLEQEELMFFNEQVFMSSTLQVTSNRETLFNFEEQFPALEPLLKTLLRTYEGIIDQRVNIYERQLAYILRSTQEEITKQLSFMHHTGIVDYTPQKDKPQIYLVQNRISASDLNINIVNYGKRKERYRSRAEKMIRYVKEEEICRSIFIGRYFGDEAIGECGICDICLNRKKTSASPEEFIKISEAILKIIAGEKAALPVILSKLKHLPQHKTMEVLRFMQAENRLRITESGEVYAV